MLFSEALVLTAAGVRPSFSPMTLVGVFQLQVFRSCDTSLGFHSLPELRLYFAMNFFLLFNKYER